MLKVIVLAACGLTITLAAHAAPSYPPAWWQEIPRQSAASWEVLPQDAQEGEVILSKRTELGVFSNFAATPFTLDGQGYRSIEGFWQMLKFPDNERDLRNKPGIEWTFLRNEVAQMIGFEAKHAGDIASRNMKALGINWVTYRGQRLTYRTPRRGRHYQLIRRAMEAKLQQNPEVMALLLKTGDLVLRPDHSQGGDPPPAWQYHQIWMELRGELRLLHAELR